MKMSRTKSQHNIGILSVESYSCHCHHHCHCDHHRHRCCHRHLHCHQYKHCCVIFIESWYFALIFIRYLEDQWISGPHPPYTWNCFGRVEDATNNAQEAFNEVLYRLIKVKNPETNEWRHYTKLADNISLQFLPSVVPPSPIYGICRECQEILTYALRRNHSGWS